MERRLLLNSTEKYLRIASISVAFYDYIITLPAEWRFYRKQSSNVHISLSCALFILIRYVSVLTMTFSNYGYFSTAFTQQACQQYYLLAPIFKILQTMVSQVILGVRTFNIARRNRRIGIALLLLYLFSVSLEWFTDIFHRTPVVVEGNCTPANIGKVLTTWFYYLAVMSYDLVMLTISITHLLRYNPLSSRVERLVRVLIYDGIGYFIALSAVNVLNLILYHTTDFETQSAGASIAYAVTWIMSQRILIHVGEMAESDGHHLENVVVARPARKVMSGLRSQFGSKSHSKSSRSPIDAEFMSTSPRNGHRNDMELGIRVCVERSVMVDYGDEPEHSDSWGKPTVT
ncbi:uncharacterized protein EDB91DRAFT_283296 [Suillus paluster]|uniref:uncharacterized protein n=1 Tax=Suillus paluster TaxID=48578 RepID=UPI001B85C2C2|nr:uncharacterized protein EDB91DRAFT_283296 [Suillus paluster]KAG1755253.1 hypothetical protein EDB91DRAFT_283296 [Suillus paluster]